MLNRILFKVLLVANLLAPAMMYTQNRGDTFESDAYGIGSPRETVARHLYYLNDGADPVKSAQALFAGPINEEHISLAVKLKQIYDATGTWVKPELIPDDPDYRDSTLDAHRYIVLPKRFPELYVEQYVEDTDDSTTAIVWRYAHKSVAAIDDIHAQTIPIGSDLLMRLTPGVGARKVLGLQIWQYVGILIIFLFSFLVYHVLDRLFGFMIRKVIPRLFPKSFLNKDLIPPVTHPLSWLLVLLMLREWLIPSLLLPISLSAWVMTILKVLPSFFGVLVFYRLVDVLADLFGNLTSKTDTTMDDQLVPLVSTGMKLLIIAFGIIFVLQNLDVNVTALLAGVSIGGLAIALAAQDTVKNFIGSLSIFIDRPFTVGDFIDTGSFSGVVTQVGVRSTRLRASDGAMVSVPNGRLMDMTITNHGIRTYRRFATTLTVSYDTSPAAMESFVNGVREIAVKHPHSTDESVLVQFHEMADSSLNIFFAVIFDTVGYGDWLKARQDVLLDIIRLSEELGVTFAFPSTSVYVESLPPTAEAPLDPVNKITK
ncbi:MAG: mechanosensitive ion channel family protein [Bacteroidota bacterium]